MDDFQLFIGFIEVLSWIPPNQQHLSVHLLRYRTLPVTLDDAISKAKKARGRVAFNVSEDEVFAWHILGDRLIQRRAPLSLVGFYM